MAAVPLKELGDLSRELKYRQGLAPLVLTLRDMCPDASWVKCHFILKSSKVAGWSARVVCVMCQHAANTHCHICT